MNIKSVFSPSRSKFPPLTALFRDRVRTLTGKEIELDIEPDYKVSSALFTFSSQTRVKPFFFGKQNITICKCLYNTSCALTLGLPHKGACGGEGRDSARAAAVDFRWEADVRELMFFLLVVLAFPSSYQTPTLANNPLFFCFLRHLLLRIVLVRKGVVNDALTRR